MSGATSSELAMPLSSAPSAGHVAAGLDAYVTRLMRGVLWAAVVFLPIEVGLAVAGGAVVPALVLGGALGLVVALGLATSARSLRWMRTHPWCLVALAGAVGGLLWALESGPLGPYFGSLVYLPVALASLGGRPLYAVGAALVICGSNVAVATAVAGESFGELMADSRWLLDASLPLMLAVGLSFPVWFLVRFMGALPDTLVEINSEVADSPPPLELPAGSDPWSALSPAQQRVVARLPEEAPKQIARELGLSLATVRTHIQHAKRATHSRTQAQLAAWAARHRPDPLGDPA